MDIKTIVHEATREDYMLSFIIERGEEKAELVFEPQAWNYPLGVVNGGFYRLRLLEMGGHVYPHNAFDALDSEGAFQRLLDEEDILYIVTDLLKKEGYTIYFEI